MPNMPHANPIYGASEALRISNLAQTLDTSTGLPTRVTSGPVYARCWGDSITESVSNPIAGNPGYRGTLQQLDRTSGYTLRMLGTRLTGWVPANAASTGPATYAPGSSRNEGVSGNTIEQVTARVPPAIATELARTGRVADVEFVMAGTNNFGAGDSNATMWTKLLALVDAIRAANATGWIVVCSVPEVPAYAALRASYNAGIQANVTDLRDAKVIYLDTCSDFTDAEQGITAGPTVDGHPSPRGHQTIGSRMYDWFRSIYSLPVGKPSPRPFVAGLAGGSISITETNSQVYWPSNPATLATPFSTAVAGTKRVLMGINFLPTTLSAAARSIFMYSDYGANKGFMVAANADVLSLYMPGSGGPFASGYGVLRRGLRQRIWFHFDDAEGGIGTLFATPAGRPVIVAQGVCSSLPVWSSGTAADYLIVGAASASILAYPGLYDSFECCAGSAVPHLDDLLPCLEANYFEHAALPGRKAYLPLNEGTGAVSATADAMNGTNMGASVFGAGAGWAFRPNPWDALVGEQKGTFVVNGATGVVVPVAGMVAGDEADIQITRIATGGTPGAVPYVVCAAGQFTATGIAADTSTYAWRWRP